jgi:uncharacterized membrane protein
MYGWWFMPIFGIVFLLIVLFIVSRFFGSWGGFCGRPPADRDSGIEELRKEISALRDEVKELKSKREGGRS